MVPEGPRLEAEPEYEGVEMEELASLDGWVHAKGCLLAKQNRVNVWTKPEKVCMSSSFVYMYEGVGRGCESFLVCLV